MGVRGRRTEPEMLADIHTAALQEVLAVGVAGLTMAGIAERSGTARTSLYRRWSSATDVLLDALESDFPREEVSPRADDLRGDLLAALEQLVGWTATPTAQAVAAIMLERRRYPELVEALFERVFDPHGVRFTRTVLLHYGQAGVIDPALITDVVTEIGEALVSAYYANTGDAPGRDYLERIVDQAILPAVGYPVTAGRRRAARG